MSTHHTPTSPEVSFENTPLLNRPILWQARGKIRRAATEKEKGVNHAFTQTTFHSFLSGIRLILTMAIGGVAFWGLRSTGGGNASATLTLEAWQKQIPLNHRFPLQN